MSEKQVLSKYECLQKLENEGQLKMAVNCGVVSSMLYVKYLAYKRYLEIRPQKKSNTDAYLDIAVEFGYKSAEGVRKLFSTIA